MPSSSHFKKLLKRNTLPFYCPVCPTLVYADQFEDHFALKHDVPLQSHCAWCLGNKNWSSHFPDTEHLSSCYHTFIKSLPRTVLWGLDTPTVPNMEPMCEEEKFFNFHLGIPTDPICEMALVPSGLTYQSANLTLAVACLQLFLKSFKTSDWYHVMIREPAIPSFSLVLKESKGTLQTLPFSCLCQGGGIPHRHFILVATSKGQFVKQDWKKIKCPQKNTNIRKQAIVSPMQLVHVLGYVSQRETVCNFTFQNATDMGEGPKRLDHYYVLKSLPRLYKLVLVMQWDGGILELINREYASIDPSLLAPAALLSSGLWVLRIGDLPGIETNLVLPVSRDFEPVPSQTEYYVHLMNGDKFYFKKTVEPVDEWTHYQADRGNVLHQMIGDYLYYPTPYQQTCLSLMKPRLIAIERLQEALKEKNGELKRAQESMEKLRNTNKSWKRKVNNAERQLMNLQHKHLLYLEQENDYLRMTNENLKRKKSEDEEDEV